LTVKQLRYFFDWLRKCVRQYGLTNCWAVTTGPLNMTAKMAKTERVLAEPNTGIQRVLPGHQVTLFDTELQEEVTFRLVAPEDSDPASAKLSYQSPLGSALLGRNKGDVVEVKIFGRREVFLLIRIDLGA
jgi:transcription elongation GreA/GreB family factor